jgi:hypothetical protein
MAFVLTPSRAASCGTPMVSPVVAVVVASGGRAKAAGAVLRTGGFVLSPAAAADALGPRSWPTGQGLPELPAGYGRGAWPGKTGLDRMIPAAGEQRQGKR